MERAALRRGRRGTRAKPFIERAPEGASEAVKCERTDVHERAVSSEGAVDEERAVLRESIEGNERADFTPTANAYALIY